MNANWERANQMQQDREMMARASMQAPPAGRPAPNAEANRMLSSEVRSAEAARRKANVQVSKIRITTEAEYDRLRPGTYFTGPDGKVRRKP
jgi:hypothetical protein